MSEKKYAILCVSTLVGSIYFTYDLFFSSGSPTAHDFHFWASVVKNGSGYVLALVFGLRAIINSKYYKKRDA